MQRYQHGQPFYVLRGFGSEGELKRNLMELYQSASQPQIARTLGTTVGQISRLFARYRIKTRSFAAGNNARIRGDVKVTDTQKEILDGVMLGDGHLAARKYTASLRYTCKHRSVVDDLASRLPFTTRINRRVKDDSINFNLATLSHRQLLVEQRRWYRNRVKVVPKDIKLTATVCYWWYLGDGTSGNNHLRLYTNSFKVNEVRRLASLLRLSGICAEQAPFNNQGHVQPIIRIPTAGIEPFLRFIGPCQHPAYRYKWVMRRGRSRNGKRYVEKIDLSRSGSD